MSETCYRCGNEPYLSKYYEEIDGEQRMICGRCREVVCSICGKTKFKDGINKWTHSIDKETGEMLNFGECCIIVEGKTDPIKSGMEKYNDLKRKSPEVIEHMDNQAAQNAQKRQQLFNSNSKIADNIIDSWAGNKRKNKILTGK